LLYVSGVLGEKEYEDFVGVSRGTGGL
jgi:hypothetical protein